MTIHPRRENKPYVIGVDVGGSKIAAALVDPQGGLSGVHTHPTDVSSPEATLNSIASTVQEVIRQTGVPPSDLRGVGLGIPGLVDPQRGLGIASVNLQWENVEVVQELEKRLELPCTIENDVKAAALGEARFGAGKGVQSLVFLNIGTGVAAALVVDGKVFRGERGMAGEIGHAVVDINGPVCKCGGKGCLEAIIAGPAIVARAAQKTAAYPDSQILHLLQSGKEVTSQDVYTAAQAGDCAALETVHEISRFLAIAIQFLSLAYDPQRVILGGGVVTSSPQFLGYLMDSIQQLADESWVFRHLVYPGFIQLTSLGNQIAILGAAALIP
jgi:glucokinase